MKLVLSLLLLITTSFAQSRSSPSETFKSPDGAFQFRYSRSLVRCEPQYEKPDPGDPEEKSIPTGWSPASCGGYLPICPDTDLPLTANGALHSEPVVCVAYPNKRYEGTSFTGAAFSVSEVPDAPSKSACFEDRTGDQKTHWENIGGVQFKASLNGDAGTSHGSVHYVYLTFHNGRCYDLEIRMSYLTSTCCDAKEYKKMEFKDDEKVHRMLRRVLNSFRFPQ